MKKIGSLFISLLIAVLSCSPAFAATKSETVTVTFDKVEDLVIDNSNYGSTGGEQILRAQIQYLTYCNDLLTLDSNTIEYNSKAQAVETAKKKLERGLISQQDYDDAVQEADDQISSQHTDADQRQQNQLTLRHMFGLDDDDKMEVKSPNYGDIEIEKKLSNLNYKKDLEDWDLDDLSGSDATDSENTNKVETFKKLYDALRTAGQTYSSDNGSYQKKQTDAQKMQQKIEIGYADQEDLDNKNQQVQKYAKTVAIDKNNLFIAYLKYDFLRDNGYDGTQGNIG